MRLQGRLSRLVDVTAEQREEMYTLMDRHYAHVSRDAFEVDLEEKQWVIQVFDPSSGALCGFSTQVLLEVEVDGRLVTALFSGDTIIARPHWGDSALAHVWGRLALSVIEASPAAELYWFLISKGYKTYRFLPVFFHEFYPRYDEPTPPLAAEVIGSLGRHKYPREYDPSAGVVRAGRAQYCLRKDVAEITPERLRDPHVRFFVERNPGHARGEELCCIAPLSRENFTPAAYRVIGREPAAAEVR